MTINDFRFTPPRTPARASRAIGWAIRRDWPVDGTHEFVRLGDDLAEVLRQAVRDSAYWQRGPVRPRVAVVRISHHEFWLHARARRDCRAPDCPVAVLTGPDTTDSDWPFVA
jgi:hypothetical protein